MEGDVSTKRLRGDAEEARVPGPRAELPPRKCKRHRWGDATGASQPTIPQEAALTTTPPVGTTCLSSLRSGDTVPWLLKALSAAAFQPQHVSNECQDFTRPFWVPKG